MSGGTPAEPAAEKQPAPEQSQRVAWSSDGRNAAGSSRNAPRLRRALMATLWLALMGAFAGVFSWIEQPGTPLFLPIFVTQQTDRGIPSLPFGERDRAAISSGDSFNRVEPVSELSPSREALLTLLGRVAMTPAGDNVVVYLSGRGTVRQDGTVSILAADASVGSAAQFANVSDRFAIRGTIELSQVYDVMRKCPSRQKLLILDIFHLFVNVPAGVVNFDLPERALAEYDALAPEQEGSGTPFHLLIPCLPGQRSHANKALGGSVFRHFLSDALAWRLPMPPDSRSKRLGKVHLSELCDIIGPRIDRWVAENEVERQYPLLRSQPGADRFVLSVPLRETAPATPEETEPEAAELPKQVELAWKTLEEAGAGLGAITNPRIRSQLFFLALNATVAHLGSAANDATLMRLESDIEKLRRAVATDIALMPTPGAFPTLGMLSTDTGLVIPAEAVRALADSLPAVTTAATQKPEEKAAALKGQTDAFLKAHSGLSAQALEGVAVSVATAIQAPLPIHWQYLSDLVATHHREAVTAEGRLLLSIGRHSLTEEFDPVLARQTLSTNRLVNLASARWETYSWIGNLMDEMNESCMMGTWLAGKSPVIHAEEARAKLDSASSLALFVDGFHEVLISASADLENAALDLAGLLAFPVLLPAGWEEYAARCENLINEIRRFRRDTLVGYQQARDLIGRIRELSKGLRSIHDQIHQPASKAGIDTFEKLVKEGSKSTSILLELESSVRLVGIARADRFRLIAIRSRLKDDLAKGTMAKEAEDLAEKTFPPPLPAFNPADPAWSPWHGKVELDRVELALKMISIGGLKTPTMDRLAALIGSIRSGRHSNRAWGELGETIRQIYLSEIPAFIRANEKFSVFFTMMYPGWLPLPQLDDPVTNPYARTRRKQREDHIAWLETRFRHLAGVGIDSSFWKEQTRLVIGRNQGRKTTGITAETPAPVFIPPPGEHADVEVRWILDGLDDLRVAPSLVRSAESPVIASVTGTRRDSTGGVVTVRIERRPTAVQALVTKATPVVLELSAGGRSTPVLITVLPDPAADLPRILLSSQADDSALMGDDILMRGSGSALKVFPRLRAIAGKPANVAVVARLRSAEGERLLGPVAVSVAAGATVPLPLSGFLGGPPPAAGAAPAGAPAAQQPPVSVSLPAKLILEIRDQANPSGPVVSRQFNLDRMEPSDIVEIVSATVGPDPAGGGASRLRVGLRAKRPPLADPPCRVELSLDRRKIPRVGAGNIRGVVPKDGSTVFLEQNGIVNSADSRGEGQFTINIDGAPMLYRLQADFRAGDNPEGAELVRKPYLGLTARYSPPAISPDGKSPPVDPLIGIEAWATSVPEGATLRLDLLGGPGFTNVERSQVLSRGLRSVVNLSGSEGGAWILSREESTWRVDWDVEGTKGAKQVRLQLVSASGEVIQTMVEPVFIDPVPVRFVDVSGLPREVLPGATYPVVVLLDPPESGVREVVAFPGAPSPATAGAPAPGPAPGVPLFPVALKGRVATVQVAIPADQKGPLTLSLVATSGGGVPAVFTRVAPAGTPRPLAEPSVEGVVTEGGRPQAGVEVVLLDPKGKKAGSAKTDEKGFYRIANMKKGDYVVKAAKVESKRSASAKLSLEPGPPAKADLALLE